MNHHTTFAAVPPLNWLLFLAFAVPLLVAYAFTRPAPVAEDEEATS